MLINDYKMDLFCPPCNPGSEAWVATVHVDVDLSALIPYMNAVVKNGYYDPDLPTLVWKEGAHKFFIRKNEFGINNLHDRAHAERKVAKFMGADERRLGETGRDRTRLYFSQAACRP